MFISLVLCLNVAQHGKVIILVIAALSVWNDGVISLGDDDEQFIDSALFIAWDVVVHKPEVFPLIMTLQTVVLKAPDSYAICIADDGL